MNGRAYYNEIDTDAAAVLRALIDEGLIAPGDVDSRSIKEVTAEDVRGYTQCHWFAGAGLWSVAARLAGWPDERPFWTASCPCQPFSAAGRGLGVDDPRHLWPDLFRILSASRAAGYGPPVIMGEQVSGQVGYGWFDGVRADLATEDYAGRARDVPTCAVDAPHERNRLWWIAVAYAKSVVGGREFAQRRSSGRTIDGIAYASGALADAESCSSRAGLREVGAQRHGTEPANGDGGHVVLVDAASERRREGGTEADVLGRRGAVAVANVREQQHRPNGSWWADGEWITCHDGKARRAKSSIPMLVNGMAGRSDLWRLAGNSISPILASEVIGAFLDAEAVTA